MPYVKAMGEEIRRQQLEDILDWFNKTDDAGRSRLHEFVVSEMIREDKARFSELEKAKPCEFEFLQTFQY